MEFLIQVDEAHSKVDIIRIIEVMKWARNLYCFHILLDVVKILILIRLPKLICVHIPPRAATENSIKKYKSKVNK